MANLILPIILCFLHLLNDDNVDIQVKNRNDGMGTISILKTLSLDLSAANL